MRAEKVIYSLVSGSSAIQALVGTSPTRVYSGLLPQGTVFPAISMHLVSATRQPPFRFGVGNSLVAARMQVTTMALDYPTVKTITEALRVLLDRNSGTFLGIVVASILLELEEPDDYDADNQVFYQSQDFMVTHYE